MSQQTQAKMMVAMGLVWVAVKELKLLGHPRLPFKGSFKGDINDCFRNRLLPEPVFYHYITYTHSRFILVILVTLILKACWPKSKIV